MSELYSVGIYSDTHGWLDPQLVEKFDGCAEIWHAGDAGDSSVFEPWLSQGKLKAVFGNIDGNDVRLLAPEFQFFRVQGFPILMMHIAGKYPRYSPLAARLIRELKPGMLVCGHSHICRVVKEGGLLYVNPGAAGRNGFHNLRTALRMGFRGGKPAEVQVIELGPRSGFIRDGGT
jgi:putative phosphoesterase